MSQNVSVFQPSALRCFMVSMGAGLIGGSVAFLLVPATDGRNMSIIGSMIGFLLVTLLTLRYKQRAWSIIITDEYVSGPSACWGKKVVIPLSKLTENSIGKDSFLIRLLREKHICSTDGKKIRIEQMAFTVEQAREMLEQFERRQSSFAHSNQVHV